MELVVTQVGGDVWQIDTHAAESTRLPSDRSHFVSISSSLGATLFELQIDHLVMAITSAEAMLWHTVSDRGSYDRMLRVS
jgi:hypothetical protein